MNNQMIGSLALLLGVIIAVLAGAGVTTLAPEITQWVPLALVILGLAVGFLNISNKDMQPFLIAGIALISVGIPGAALSAIPVIGILLVKVLSAISTFAAPAVLVVSLKAFYNLSKASLK